MEKVILVDEHDVEKGSMEKMEAHQKGLLHRAVSILVFNDQDEMLMQKRASSKYHSANLWTNTCCSHPRVGENVLAAAERRLQEEMGMTVRLEKKFDFIYRAELDHGLIEHEFDHVFFGRSNQNPVLNLKEASAFRWMTLVQVKEDLIQNPSEYTEWFKILVGRI